MRSYQISAGECKMCLKCLQECPVHGISLHGGSLKVVESRCVDCGKCAAVCPHGAVEWEDQTGKVRQFLRAKRKVILSLDPAVRALLPEGVTVEQLASAAQAAGFWDVADASEAVAAVASEYARLLAQRRSDTLLLSHCPVVRNMVEQYYPELLGMLAPVASPMIAHGRMLKRDFTSAAVVYVTTCLARAQEARDVRHSTEINAVLTFEQLMDFLQEAGVDAAECEEEPLLGESGGMGILGGGSGGVLKVLEAFTPARSHRRITAQGMVQMTGVLESLRSGRLHGCIVDLYACHGGCVGGVAGRMSRAEACMAKLQLELQAEQEPGAPQVDIQGIAMATPAISRAVGEYVPGEQEIGQMLERIGVANPAKQEDCGECGYPTCRSRAEAILLGRENVNLCPRAARLAELGIHRTVYESLPMAALLVDDSQKVVALNREARSLFSVQPDQEKYIFELMDPGDFQYVINTGLAIRNRRMDIPEIYMRVEADLVPLKSLNMVLGLFRDVTAEEERESELQQSRLQSVEMAQKVIEKQMTVAQQIAFLLGETTAETKVTLNQLKARILEEDES